MYAKYPKLLYVFQDPYTAGWRDVSYALFANGLSFRIREKMGIDLMEQILMCVEGQSSSEELRNMLYRQPRKSKNGIG